MPHIINGVAYTEDYEDLVGPIPAEEKTVKAKVIKSDHSGPKHAATTTAETK